MNTDWQPIETAPKDGTVIDVWHKEGLRISALFWDSKEGGWCGFDQILKDDELTHWKPITKPENANTDWQPIGTAPKDGTMIDLWHICGVRFCHLWWGKKENGWCERYEDLRPRRDSDFTHWKPITEPEIRG